MNNLTVCGGLNGDDVGLSSCMQFDDSGVGFTWLLSHQQNNQRCRHVSWDVDDFVYLIGGDDAAGNEINRIEKVSSDGSVEESNPSIQIKPQ